MTAAILIFLLLLGGLLQSFVPALAWLGLSKPPFLLGVALYYALVHSRTTALAAAILAGIIQDSLSLFPVGTSALCFTVFALALHRTRETLFRDSLFTVAALGAVLSALTTLGLCLLVSGSEGGVAAPFWWVALKTGGTAVLGLFTAPVVWGMASWLERHVGALAGGER